MVRKEDLRLRLTAEVIASTPRAGSFRPAEQVPQCAANPSTRRGRALAEASSRRLCRSAMIRAKRFLASARLSVPVDCCKRLVGLPVREGSRVWSSFGTFNVTTHEPELRLVRQIRLGIPEFNGPKSYGSSQRTTTRLRVAIVVNHSANNNTLRQRTFKQITQISLRN